MIVTSSSNGNTPTYWVTTSGPQGSAANLPTAASAVISAANYSNPGQGRRTASSGLLMNIGYLNSQDEISDELTARPASAGAAAVTSGLPESSVLYDYPPITHGATTNQVSSLSSRHRGVSLRKQHSVSCASSQHCCENNQKV